MRCSDVYAQGLEAVLKNPGEEVTYSLLFSPSRDFKFEFARERLVALSHDIFERDRQGSFLSVENDSTGVSKCSSLIDLDARQAICAAGGLIQVTVTVRIGMGHATSQI